MEMIRKMQLFILAVLLIFGNISYCVEEAPGPDVDTNVFEDSTEKPLGYSEQQRTFGGTIVHIDLMKSIISVSGAGAQIDFPIKSSTRLMSDIYDIKLSDFKVGDYVTVQYYRRGNDSEAPLDVFEVTLEYHQDNWNAI